MQQVFKDHKVKLGATGITRTATGVQGEIGSTGIQGPQLVKLGATGITRTTLVKLEQLVYKDHKEKLGSTGITRTNW